MSEQREASLPADVAKRKMTPKGAAGSGALVGLVVGWSDYFILQCFTTGHFVWVTPEKGLVEVTALIVIFPVVVWIGNIFRLIGDAITERIEKESNEQ